MDYKKPSVTVDIVVLSPSKDIIKVLLIKRKHAPFVDCWALPGGFLDLTKKETLEEAAARELQEETSIEGVDLEQFKAFSTPDRDLRDRVIAVCFYTFISPEDLSKYKIEAADDAKELKWVSIDDIIIQGKYDLAFDHATILEELYIKRITNVINRG